MKKLTAIVLLILITVSCSSQKAYSDFDISYSKSGGDAPVYENLIIKGTHVHYSFENKEKTFKTDFTLTDNELENLNEIINQNNFRQIAEDHKKLYDHVSIVITVKKGRNSASKTDASLIMPQHRKNWNNIVEAFQKIIQKNIKN